MHTHTHTHSAVRDVHTSSPIGKLVLVGLLLCRQRHYREIRLGLVSVIWITITTSREDVSRMT